MKYLSLVALTGFVAGCSSLNSITDTTNIIDYSNHKSVKVLQVPADLDKPVFDNTYVTNVSDNLDAAKLVVPNQTVPLVDNTMAAPAASSLKTVKQGEHFVLQVANSGKGFWESSLSALKAMGMTVNKSDQASGLVDARDRSLVSSPDSAIGAFLNRTMGRVNQGTEYQVLVEQGVITFKGKSGQALSESDATSLLGRLKKELSSSK